ncbi:hypothetical protein [Thalassolituus marinus]|uniref:Lipase chaperone n=1 Tax=Thalassolituus marinus TaxID=671053 RepID=A0ABS7ZP00_9GAMM|nr:hypothetical protein [Thalassolituus marinus]MCA6063354.1 hypothetical protein [Thalassolituus marinus]
MKWFYSLAALLFAALTLLVFNQSADVVVIADEVLTTQSSSAPVTKTSAPAAKIKQQDQDDSAELPELSDDDMEAWLPRLNSDAIASMAQARTQGDARTPPIIRSAPRQMPTAAELADEELYQKYEQRQEKRLFRAYVEASAAKIAVIESFIDQAEAGGISEEEIAFAKQKIEGIRAQSEQLLRDNPDLMADEFQSPDNWLPATDNQ